MSLLVDKVLSVFIFPLGAALFLGILALTLSFTRWRNLARAVLAIAVVGLWVASTPLFSHSIVERLESQYPPQRIEDLPTGDAIVLLGGFLGQPLPPRVAPDISDAGDRALEALRLYRAGKAPRIVISGGNLPWDPTVEPEAVYVADLLVELGVPRTDLVLDGDSRNTRENAVNTARIFATNGWSTGLLVTSGMHMPRALAVFRRVGLDVTPASTDVSVRSGGLVLPFDFLPDVKQLGQTTLAVKEVVGGFVYRLRGWE
jgi:uncharacterized SAM-binding protein YcdF (DUF218 family)